MRQSKKTRVCWMSRVILSKKKKKFMHWHRRMLFLRLSDNTWHPLVPRVVDHFPPFQLLRCEHMNRRASVSEGGVQGLPGAPCKLYSTCCRVNYRPSWSTFSLRRGCCCDIYRECKGLPRNWDHRCSNIVSGKHPYVQVCAVIMKYGGIVCLPCLVCLPARPHRS